MYFFAREMGPLKRSFLFVAVVVGIICLPPRCHAFSSRTTSCDHHGTSRRHRRRDATITIRIIRLFAEPISEEGSSSRCSGRRGFIGACVAAAAAAAGGAAVVITPSNAMALRSDDHVAIIGTAVNDDETTPIINNDNGISSQQTLLVSSDDDKPPASATLSAFQESISGFVSGSAVSTVKTLVKYPLDTATVRLQMPDTRYAIENLPELFGGSLDGIAAPLLSNIPAGAVFFAVKDATKSSLRGFSGMDLPKWAVTSLAVAAALPPYWLIRNPSEVVKTRLQAGAEGYYEGMSTLDAFKLALSDGGGGVGNSTVDGGGVGELYKGYAENILYGFPADIIKFVAYDTLTGGKGKNGVSPAEGAVYGAFSTAVAQLATTPLDVLRNRIMAETTTTPSSSSNSNDGTDDDDAKATLSYVDRLAKIAREEGAGALFAGTWPRVAKAVLSGAIQFATYEETKQKIGQLLLIKR